MANILKRSIPLSGLFHLLTYLMGATLLFACSVLYLESKAIVFRSNVHAVASGVYNFRYYRSINLNFADTSLSRHTLSEFSRGQILLAVLVVKNVSGPIAFRGAFSVSLWWFIAPSVVLALRNMRKRHVRNVRRRTNCCLECGYSLNTLTS